MRIIMIDYFLPENPYSYELTKELRKKVNIELFCRENIGKSDSFLFCRSELYCGNDKKIIAAIKYFKGIQTLLKEIKKDCEVIHVQAFQHIKIELFLFKMLRRKNRILVHTVHNILPHENKESMREIYSKIYKTCDLLIVHNDWSKRELQSNFNISAEKIKVIPHGIYGNLRTCPAKPERKTTQFLFFGSIRKYKGVDVLLQAIALLPSDVKELCSFVIAGNQKAYHDITDYPAMAEELGISNNVCFVLHYLEDQELDKLICNADACIFPYHEIYGSGALLMAYTYQKPVIASNVPAFIEETENGQTGLLFESGNPQSLADMIEKFVKLDSRQKQKFSENIRILAEAKYNWKSSADKTFKAYLSVLNKANR